jgi:hypothetical protein
MRRRRDERAERRRQLHELHFSSGFLGVVVECRSDAVEMTGASSRMQADSSVTDTTAQMLIVNWASIPAEFLRAPSPPSCLCCSQPDLSWLSTSMRRRRRNSMSRRERDDPATSTAEICVGGDYKRADLLLD